MTEQICKKGDSFADCELAILRSQVDKAQEKISRRVVNTPEVKEMISIVEDFIKKKGLVCYGGISINALLPDEDKIYNDEIDLPDYDMFSPDALEDAKELADIYYKKGYSEVEARSGQHMGTYKVFTNFQGMADITSLPKELYAAIKSKAVSVNGIFYTDPNYLRMSMYLELSRPAGDTSRWEKVMKRLALINKHYPLDDKKCNYMEFQRKMENKEKGDEIYETVKNVFINQGVVFFGGYAISQYSQYMPKQLRKKVEKNADFDVISNDPQTTSEIVKERLKDKGITNVKIIKRDPIGEIIPLHYEIKVGVDTIAFVYKPIACHSYNVLMFSKKKIKIATIDTMLNFYLAFLYTNRPYYTNFTDRILCMSQFLFDVQQKNRLKQKGLLKRFSIICYGHQESVEEMRTEKAKKYKELKDKRGTREYEEWFLNYRPDKINKKEDDINEENKGKKEDKEDENKSELYKPKKNTTKRKKKKNKNSGFFNIFSISKKKTSKKNKK
jgi:hypothetical protein